MDPTIVESGTAHNATTWTSVALSAVVTEGSNIVGIRFLNTDPGEQPLWVHHRKTGSSDDWQNYLLEKSSIDVTIALTTARTFDYYVESGKVDIYVVDFSGTTMVSSSVTADDVRTPWLSGHDSTEISDAELTTCISKVTIEVNKAAQRHANIANVALDTDIKNYAIIIGAASKALPILRERGASKGLSSDMIVISNETAERYRNDYERMLDRMMSGTYYSSTS